CSREDCHVVYSVSKTIFEPDWHEAALLPIQNRPYAHIKIRLPTARVIRKFHAIILRVFPAGVNNLHHFEKFFNIPCEPLIVSPKNDTLYGCPSSLSACAFWGFYRFSFGGYNEQRYLFVVARKTCHAKPSLFKMRRGGKMGVHAR
ncbi:MAG TPA: hypothetical protein DEB39_14095, partial [Planctomycetaceae bacterium]|nr:hypothetical protein [Planctomycetaceae bacterium]